MVPCQVAKRKMDRTILSAWETFGWWVSQHCGLWGKSPLIWAKLNMILPPHTLHNGMINRKRLQGHKAWNRNWGVFRRIDAFRSFQPPRAINSQALQVRRSGIPGAGSPVIDVFFDAWWAPVVDQSSPCTGPTRTQQWSHTPKWSNKVSPFGHKPLDPPRWHPALELATFVVGQSVRTNSLGGNTCTTVINYELMCINILTN